MSYMSLVAAERPASGPWLAPVIGALRSCGTKAERTLNFGVVSTSFSRVGPLGQIPVENLFAIPGGNAGTAQDFRKRPLDMRDPVRHAGQIRMTGNRHNFRAFGRFLIK